MYKTFKLLRTKLRRVSSRVKVYCRWRWIPERFLVDRFRFARIVPLRSNSGAYVFPLPRRKIAIANVPCRCVTYRIQRGKGWVYPAGRGGSRTFTTLPKRLRTAATDFKRTNCYLTDQIYRHAILARIRYRTITRLRVTIKTVAIPSDGRRETFRDENAQFYSLSSTRSYIPDKSIAYVFEDSGRSILFFFYVPSRLT